MDNANLIKGIIGSLVRYALMGTVGALVTKGVITAEQGELLIPAIIMGVITVAWGIWNKHGISKRIEVALKLPAGAGPEELERAVAAKG